MLTASHAVTDYNFHEAMLIGNRSLVNFSRNLYRNALNLGKEQNRRAKEKRRRRKNVIIMSCTTRKYSLQQYISSYVIMRVCSLHVRILLPVPLHYTTRIFFLFENTSFCNEIKWILHCHFACYEQKNQESFKRIKKEAHEPLLTNSIWWCPYRDVQFLEVFSVAIIVIQYV